MKKSVLFADLEKHLPAINGESPMELTQKIFEATRVTAAKKEMENFCNRYVKTLKLKIVVTGSLVLRYKDSQHNISYRLKK